MRHAMPPFGFVVLFAIMSISASISLSLPAHTSAQTTQPAKNLVNVDKHGLAIQGYDPMAYFTQQAAVKGDENITATHRGATYHFANEKHRERFLESPDQYAPQFGGYCAYGVSKNVLAKIEPGAFMIVDGRLLLQYNKSIVKTFESDTEHYLKKADTNWPDLLEKRGQ